MGKRTAHTCPVTTTPEVCAPPSGHDRTSGGRAEAWQPQLILYLYEMGVSPARDSRCRFTTPVGDRCFPSQARPPPEEIITADLAPALIKIDNRVALISG